MDKNDPRSGVDAIDMTFVQHQPDEGTARVKMHRFKLTGLNTGINGSVLCSDHSMETWCLLRSLLSKEKNLPITRSSTKFNCLQQIVCTQGGSASLSSDEQVHRQVSRQQRFRHVRQFLTVTVSLGSIFAIPKQGRKKWNLVRQELELSYEHFLLKLYDKFLWKITKSETHCWDECFVREKKWLPWRMPPPCERWMLVQFRCWIVGIFARAMHDPERNLYRHHCSDEKVPRSFQVSVSLFRFWHVFALVC